MRDMSFRPFIAIEEAEYMCPLRFLFIAVLISFFFLITYPDSHADVWWTADGVAISTAANTQNSPQITSDSAGGAIITWHDFRSGNADIYAQRIL